MALSLISSPYLALRTYAATVPGFNLIVTMTPYDWSDEMPRHRWSGPGRGKSSNFPGVDLQ